MEFFYLFLWLHGSRPAWTALHKICGNSALTFLLSAVLQGPLRCLLPHVGM
jgi:hypothetical protein